MRKSNIKNSGLWSILCILLLGLAGRGQAQSERFPANVSPMLNAPYSLFLEDYTDPGKNQLVANVLFNDFNEPSWTFRLKLTIESTDVRLSTKNGFVPLDPITVQPGVVTPFSSTDWIEYFDFSNLDISGSGTELVRQNGRLPEGLYSFCIEVLDYETGDPLSRETCTNVWIQLNDPPRIISPICGNMVDPKLISFPIQWQLFNTQSPNAEMGTTYDLTMWQLTDPTADPFVAVPNGQALQVFQTTNLSSTTFIYGAAEPLLDIGETYVYQIKANALDGRDSFKNNGRSEFCHFNYGWPEGGEIELKWPEYDGGFKSEEQPYLSWGAPNNKRPNQPIAYQIEVMKMDEGQSPEEALALNEPWFTYQQPPTFNGFGGSINLPNLGKSEKYAWKITAFASEQMIAESKVGLMNGPSLVEFFYAGNHRVNVDYINGKDVTNISGGGEVRVTPAVDEWTNLTFENISLIDNGGFWVLDRGSIEFDIQEERIIELSPQLSDNGGASFDIQKYRLNPNGLYAFGQFLWDLPHATLSTEKPVVKSIEDWANFNNFTVNTVIELPENGNRFDLLEPYGFTLDLYQSSLVFINTDQFRFEFDGEVFVPESVQRRQTERASFTFENADQLYYISRSERSLTASNDIRIISNTRIWLTANKYEIDFSDEVSSDTLSPDWKGIHLSSIDLLYEDSFDNAGQFDLNESYVQTHDGSNGVYKASVTSKGINLNINCNYPSNTLFKFQTFPSHPYNLKLKIEENYIDQESELEGKFLIPVVSVQDKFTYKVPITQTGLKKGYLEGLDGYQFVHGKEDQQVEVKIKRAALAGNEKINMAVDLKWNSLGMNLEDITGFTAWGDYNVGFGEKGGAISLPERVNTIMKGYPVTIDVIAAGSSEGFYAFATTMEIEMGEDVSGVEDAPTTNFYGLMANEYAPPGDLGAYQNFSEEQLSPEEIVAQKTQEIEAQQDQIEKSLNDLTFNYPTNTSENTLVQTDQLYQSSEVQEYASVGSSSLSLSNAQSEIISNFTYEVTDALFNQYFSDHLNKIDSVKNKVEGLIQNEVYKIGGKIEYGVDSIVNTIGSLVLNVLPSNDQDLINLVEGLKRDAAATLKEEVKASFEESVRDNITTPILDVIEQDIKGGLNALVVSSAGGFVTAAIKGESMDGLGMNVLDDLGSGFTDILLSVFNTFKPGNVMSSLYGTLNGVYSSIDQGAILDDLKGEALAGVGRYVVDKVADAVGDELVGALGDLGNAAQLIETGIEIANAVQSVHSLVKDPAKAYEDVLADVMPVVNKNPVFELNGYVKFHETHPNFGDVWVGDVDLTIKQPSKFTLNTLYLQGRKDGFSYYFAEVKVTDDASEYKLGDPLDEVAPAALSNGPLLGAVRLAGIGGRLYKKMRIQEDKTILPDASMLSGWKIGMVLVDNYSGGSKLRIAVSGESLRAANGDKTWRFAGDVQINSPSPKIEEPDDMAALHGLIDFSYNSAEKEFIGYIEGAFDAPTLCLAGSLFIHTRPGYWRVAIGSMEMPIDITVPCPGINIFGYVDISSERLEVGGGIGLGGSIVLPPGTNVDIWLAQFNVLAYAWVEVGGGFAINWKPFTPEKMFVWIEVVAGIDLNYRLRALWNPFKKWTGWRSITLIQILIRGDATLNFYPRPIYLEGKFKAGFKVVGISFSVNAQGKLNL
ncbi:MAG: hypothetical protein AAF843_15040 [Bacteroidota bacterium]